jgi:hypothetical protein
LLVALEWPIAGWEMSRTVRARAVEVPAGVESPLRLFNQTTGGTAWAD